MEIVLTNKISKMNSDIKAKWVGALRSGGYKKVTNSLVVEGDPCSESESKPSYCVLGVLTKLYCDNKEKNILEFIMTNNACLKREVLNWAGLDEHDTEVCVMYKGHRTALTHLNDVSKLSFEKMADIIEEIL